MYPGEGRVVDYVGRNGKVLGILIKPFDQSGNGSILNKDLLMSRGRFNVSSSIVPRTCMGFDSALDFVR